MMSINRPQVMSGSRHSALNDPLVKASHLDSFLFFNSDKHIFFTYFHKVL